MQRLLILLTALSLLLASCGTLEIRLDTGTTDESRGNGPASSSPEPAAATLRMDSTSEQIQQAMLKSATKWQTIWMDGTVTAYSPDGSPVQVLREQVWIDQFTNRFRVLSGPQDSKAERFLAGDGMTILEMDLKSGQSQSRPMPEFANGPYVPDLQSGFADSQPLWGQIGTQLSELAFPSIFSQNEGDFKPLAIEMVARRQALMVEWTYIKNTEPSWKLWLDTETVVVLKAQFFQKTGGGAMMDERVVNQVMYDAAFVDSLFEIPSSLPQWGDITGEPIQPVETGAVPPSGKDALGELYFFTLPHQAGQKAQLVRLPGSCVVGQSACPKLESVVTPFPLDFSLTPLAWSSDGRFAAFAYPADPNGTPYQLWLFDPDAQTWKSLFEYAYIDPPLWSPDGTWLSFRVQDGLGGEDVYVVHRDGSGLRNLTASGNLPADGRPYVVDAWFTENLLVRSAKPGNEGTIYLVRASDGFVRPMFDTLLTKATLLTSPDSSLLAYDDYNYESQKHTLYVMEPDGANRVELTSFASGSLYPPVWSPDSSRVAFAYYTSYANGNPTSDVYVVNRAGRGLKQVYKGLTVSAVMFSSDGKHLLVNETTSPTGQHFFIINLETLEQHILQAPGLSLDVDWYMPSWRL